MYVNPVRSHERLDRQFNKFLILVLVQRRFQAIKQGSISQVLKRFITPSQEKQPLEKNFFYRTKFENGGGRPPSPSPNFTPQFFFYFFKKSKIKRSGYQINPPLLKSPQGRSRLQNISFNLFDKENLYLLATLSVLYG